MGGMPHGAMPRGGTPVGAAPADADVAFIEMMIPHHQGAVAMSREILETTKRPELQQLARNIIRNQEREIAQTRLVVRECPCNVGRNGRRHVGGDAKQSGRCWRAICSEAAFPQSPPCATNFVYPRRCITTVHARATRYRSSPRRSPP